MVDKPDEPKSKPKVTGKIKKSKNLKDSQDFDSDFDLEAKEVSDDGLTVRINAPWDDDEFPDEVGDGSSESEEDDYDSDENKSNNATPVNYETEKIESQPVLTRQKKNKKAKTQPHMISVDLLDGYIDKAVKRKIAEMSDSSNKSSSACSSITTPKRKNRQVSPRKRSLTAW